MLLFIQTRMSTSLLPVKCTQREAYKMNYPAWLWSIRCITCDSGLCCNNISSSDTINGSLSLKHGRESPLGRLFLVLRWIVVWCYCSIIFWKKKLLKRVKETKIREREREKKSPGKSPAPSLRHLSFPVPLTHLTDFQSLEPICWERNPTLARNETTSTPRHTTTPQRRPSPPLHTLLFSPLSSLPAHQRPGRETGRLTLSPLCLPTLHFTPWQHSSLVSLLGFCRVPTESEREREEQGIF